MRKTILLLAIAGVCAAQTSLKFEVASVRPAGDKPPHTPMPAAGEIKGGPGTNDPTRMSFTWVEPRRLLMSAFGLPVDQISGNDWVMGQGARFDIEATLPEGTTKEQANEMLLNLLQERFHLTYHREKKDFDFYALTVAKGGSKLKDAEVPDGPPPPAPAPGTRATAAPLDRDGFPILPAGRTSAQGRGANGAQWITFRMATPDLLLSMIQFDLRPARTIDKTGLTGKYDFKLMYSSAGLPGMMGRGMAPSATATVDAPDPAPDLFTAIEKQLGLRLEKSKIQLDVVVVDRMDKTPTEN